MGKIINTIAIGSAGSIITGLMLNSDLLAISGGVSASILIGVLQFFITELKSK